jgi:hypothetical protein
MMEPNLDQERRQAHALLDMLPPERLNAVRNLLEVMVEPLARSLGYPLKNGKCAGLRYGWFPAFM